MSPNADTIVRCEGLTKVYGEITALEDLTVEIPRGHIFGYIGHNGAGKTTTIRILAGLLAPSFGSAHIAGVNVVSERSKIKALVGYMPDSFGVYDQMRVWEYLDFFGAAFKIPRRPRMRRIDEVLDVTGAEYMRDRFVDTLSRGMKQRVGIARTLMHDPQVLLLDEPASGLDPKARVQMRHLLRRLADDGKTLVVSSHILPELAAVCDSIGIIERGHLLAFGPIETVLGSLRQDRLMEMKVLSAPAAARTVLDADDNAAAVDDSDLEEGLLRFSFRGDDDAMAKLLADLVGAAVRVVTLRAVPLSLEDAYMAISGRLPGEEEDEADNELAPPPAPPEATGGGA